MLTPPRLGMSSPHSGERSPWQGSWVKWSFSRSDPSLQPSSRREKETGGHRRNREGAADASPRGRLRGARAPARAGRMEEGRLGSEVPESRAAVRPRGPTPPRTRHPPSSRTRRAFRVRRLSREKSHCLTPVDLRNPATLREKCFPPCNTPRKRNMSGDDGGGKMTYPCSSQRVRSRQGETKVSGAGGAALCPPSTSVSPAAREGPAGGGRRG